MHDWAAADEHFSHLLAVACGNKRILESLETYYSQSHRLRKMTTSLLPKPIGASRDYRAVVSAIQKGDSEAADRAHRTHRTKDSIILIWLMSTHRLFGH
jgi:DNA-binding GntR family transcriptional regulator